MRKTCTVAILGLAAAVLLVGCSTVPPPAPLSASLDYDRAFRSGNFAEAARLASQTPSRDAHARLVEGMARAELQQDDRAAALLRPLLRSSDPEVRGRAAATLGLVAQRQGDQSEASRLLQIAAASLSGADGVWAASYARRAREGNAAPSSSNTRGTVAAQGGGYQIQFGSFSTEARAQRHAQAVSRITRSTGLDVPRIEPVQLGARTLYAVRAGSFASRSAASTAASQLDTETAVVRLN